MVAPHEFVSKQFALLGFHIGSHPKIFVVLPIVVTLLLTCGCLNLHFVNDIENYTLTNGIAKHDRDTVNQYFPLNYSLNFSPSRIVYPGRFARLVVNGKNERSILNKDSWSQIEELDEIIRGISVEWKGQGFNYSDLCAEWNGVCFHNEHLGMGSLMDGITNGSLRLSYPVMFNPLSFESYLLDQAFGGIGLRENSTNTVDTIQATILYYFLKNDTKEQNELGLEWEYAVIDRLKGLEGHWKDIDVSFDTYATFSIEPDLNVFTMIPYFAISITLMIGFTMATSLTRDWVTSKPLVAFMGIISAVLGASSSVGVLCFFEVDFVSIILAIPFIALGVGVDDTFVMLAAWWKTSREDSVPQRMAQCYSEAAVSITITTLTDALSFYVGLLSPVPCIQIFCGYAGTAVVFIYIWHVFFFGAILALSGKYEEQGKHSLFIWRKVIPASKAGQLSGISRWFLTDDDEKSSQGKEVIKVNPAMEFFKNSFAPTLQKRWAQIVILIVYVLYIMISMWGISQMKEGMQLYNLPRKDSYMAKFYTTFDKYFWNYPYRGQVIVTTELDYSLKETQDQIVGLIKNLTDLDHSTPKYAENWLVDYLQYLDNYKEFYDFNVTTEQDFIDILRSHFLTDTRVTTQDVKFNDNFTKIIATRYIIQSYNGSDALNVLSQVLDERAVTNSIQGLNVTVFNPLYVLADSGIILKDLTIKLIGIASVVVMVIAVIFIPSVVSCVFVFASIAAVELGVLGFMVFWGVNLDLNSVLILIACVGFSVDFPAHVCYAYISSKCETVEGRITEALHSLGLPILQGAASTIVAVSGLVFLDSYTPMVFYKIIFLIMTFSVFNALFVLPVFFLIFRPQPSKLFSKTKTYVVNK